MTDNAADVSPVRTARHAAMNLLSRREHGRRELLRKLAGRYQEEEVEAAVRQLAEDGLQSDERFAESFARQRMQRGYGPQRIQKELLARGVSGSVADRALQSMEREEGVSWRRVAREALRKKYGEPALPGDFSERARRVQFLQRRGFAEDDLREPGDW